MLKNLLSFLCRSRREDVPSEATPPAPWRGVRWDDPSAPVSKYFTVKEALWLPQWGRLATEDDGLDDGAKEALHWFLNAKMDPVREALGRPVRVHVCYRPKAYNALVGGAQASAHMARLGEGVLPLAAMDFSAKMGTGSQGKDCDAIKALLLPKLEQLGLRLEDNGPEAPWVHIDSRPAGPGGRFFRP